MGNCSARRVSSAIRDAENNVSALRTKEDWHAIYNTDFRHMSAVEQSQVLDHLRRDMEVQPLMSYTTLGPDGQVHTENFQMRIGWRIRHPHIPVS